MTGTELYYSIMMMTTMTINSNNSSSQLCNSITLNSGKTTLLSGTTVKN